MDPDLNAWTRRTCLVSFDIGCPWVDLSSGRSLCCCSFSPFDVGTGRDRRRISAVFICLIKKKEGNNISIRRIHASPLSQSPPFPYSCQSSNRTSMLASLLDFFHPTLTLLTSCGPWFVQMNRIFLDMLPFSSSRACCGHPACSKFHQSAKSLRPQSVIPFSALLSAATKPNVYSSWLFPAPARG